MLSIVTGTINRRGLLPGLISNTVETDKRLELVLVDGGSTDGTIEYVESLNHPQIKLIKIGKRSSYPHFMNLGIRSASYDFVCQWNDDALLINSWQTVLEELKKSEIDAWLFSWQYVPLEKVNNKAYCDSLPWNLCNQKEDSSIGQIVMNYGVYRKELFRKFGMFDTNFQFYYADGELSHRFYSRGARFKNCQEIRVASIEGVRKTSGPAPSDHLAYYDMCRRQHLLNMFQESIEYLP